MRSINSSQIKDTVRDLCVKANIELRSDVISALKLAKKKEKSGRAARMLSLIIYNAAIARKKRLPICQDTGMVVVYLVVGQDIRIKGDLKKAVEKGVKDAYSDCYFRKSVVIDPLKRTNTKDNLPPVIYTQIVSGRKIDIRVSIKGFGCENVSRTRMFNPTDPASLIRDFVVDIVRESGSRACPPLYVGVGIGGTIGKAVSLSKEAIFRPLGEASGKKHIARLEKSILSGINKLRIGPMGVGGRTTALGVSVLTYPTHIAGLPVAVNISCHATRDARRVI